MYTTINTVVFGLRTITEDVVGTCCYFEVISPFIFSTSYMFGALKNVALGAIPLKLYDGPVRLRVNLGSEVSPVGRHIGPGGR